jgi:DNA topoisomerase IB
MPKKKSKTLPGTVRIKASDLKVYEKTKASWKRSSRLFPETLLIIKLFRKNKRFDALIDKKRPEFLKGQLAPNGMAQGARIDILPNGKKLNKAFSLFAPHLMIHDENSKHHWDVIYQNTGGTYSYLYTLDKIRKSKNKKYQMVKEFEKCYPKLKNKVYEALKDEKDYLALPMYTLLKTCMRIGNEIYYKLRRHKGLSTMKKGDIKISGRRISFCYIGKGGIPTNVTDTFPKIYVERLQGLLDRTDEAAFIFTYGNKRHPINEEHFRAAFKKYCGREFYPHIVRSFYATSRVKKMLRKGKSIEKKEVDSLFYSIARKLGHKRFVKKEGVWRENYTVTINHYVQPEILEKVKAAVGKIKPGT